MNTGFLEDGKAVSVSDLALKLAAAPAVLGVTSCVTLSVVAFQRDAIWTPFAISLAIGGDDTETPLTMIDASGVRLVRLRGDITHLARPEVLTDFVQAWRTVLQPGAPHEALSPTANVRWHSSAPERGAAPHWEISLYEQRPESGQQAPSGKFSNLRANVPPGSIGELAAKWLGDPALRDANMPSRDIKIRVNDKRAFFSGAMREGHEARFAIAHDQRLTLIGSASGEPRPLDGEPVISPVVDGRVSFNIPDSARYLSVVLTDLDDTRYDEIHLRVTDEHPHLDRFRIEGLSNHPDTSMLDPQPTTPQLTKTEQRVAFKLGTISNDLSQAYQQAAVDLAGGDRLSWHGTAVELREVVRGVLEHLAPDDEVQQPYEDGRASPTMTDRVTHVLRSRDLSETVRDPLRQSARVMDELFARLPRMLYSQASKSTHAPATRKEVQSIKACADFVLAELLDAH